jgi:adenylate cyclase
MFTDIVGYTTLMAESEEKGLQARKRHRALLGPLAEAYRGRIVDENGDELVLSFPSALDAVNCALAAQAQLRVEPTLELRIGVHLGDVVFEEGRVYGDGVNVASRIRPLAEPGGIYVSYEVQRSIQNQPNINTHSLGEHELKNVRRPVHVFAVTGTASEPGPAVAEAHLLLGRRKPLWTALSVFLVMTLLVGAGLWASWPRPLGLLIDLAGVSGPPVNPALPESPSVVVLPFDNMSGDPEQEYFSDGITDQITADLARNPLLFVISRNSAFVYKEKAAKVEDIGRELGVRYVLEGSVRKAGDRVRITAQLIDATTDHHVWSEQYDGDLGDVFAFQSKISEEITAAMGVQMLRAEQKRARSLPTGNLTYYEAIMRGHFHHNRETRKGNAEARRWFERALELEPDLPWAYAGLGATYIGEYGSGWNNLDPASLDRGEELMRRALELDPFDMDALVGLAVVNLHRGRSRAALESMQKAVELVPNWETHQALLGVVLAQEDQLVPAIQAIKRAMRLNPRGPSSVLVSAAYVNLAAGRRQDAAALAERVRMANPDNILVRVALAAMYEYEGRHEEARVVAQEALRVNPDLTAEIAIRLVPGVEQTLEPEEAAQFGQNLQKAGFP